MKVRKLAVSGALEFTPVIYHDDRGFFVSPFERAAFAEPTGHPLFPVAQVSCSESRRGVIRGIHFTATPPGMATYVHCTRGKSVDIVVDVRVGSPTFGRYDSVLLDQEAFHATYIPVGVGHAFIALENGTTMSYLLSGGYVPEHELALSVLDPRIGLPIPDDVTPILSERDQAAPTLSAAAAAGMLPDYASCRAIEDKLLGWEARLCPAGR